MTIATIAKPMPLQPIAASIASSSAQEHSKTLVDSGGRKHRIEATTIGPKGPVQRTMHFIDGQLVAVVEYDWLPGDGGWLLRGKRVAAYQNGKETESLTMVVRVKSDFAAALRERARRTFAAVVLSIAPTVAHAESRDDDEACWWQGAALLAAGLFAGVACIPPTIVCPFALLVYNQASKDWLDCMGRGET